MNEKKKAQKRDKWHKFCPKCGKETDDFFDAVCKDCFRQGKTLLEPASVAVSLNVCTHCGDYFKGKERTNIEALVEDAVRRAIKKKHGPDCVVDISELRIEFPENERNARVFLTVKTKIQGVGMEEQGEIAVILKRETCERCSRIAGGYYAAIVQIRADYRVPTDDELTTAEDIAVSSLGEDDFVSRKQMLKEGLDIYVSSAEYGYRISRAVVKKLGGSFSESRKLYGRKDGRDIYRVTFLVRLPGFQKGEIVEFRDRRIAVENVMEGRGIEGADMNTGEQVFLTKKEMMKAKRVE
jgi:nonsense-mediated mRNA decay protein 3